MKNRTFPDVKLIRKPKDFMQELSEAEKKTIRDADKVSQTGEIAYNPSRGTLRIVSPKTESLSFFKGALAGDVLTVSDGTPTFQIVTASSMDGKPLAASGRILLFHQSDVTNRHIRYSSESMNAVEHWGKTEPLIRRASAVVQLKLEPGDYRVQVIGLDGMPKGDDPGGICGRRSEVQRGYGKIRRQYDLPDRKVKRSDSAERLPPLRFFFARFDRC